MLCVANGDNRQPRPADRAAPLRCATAWRVESSSPGNSRLLRGACLPYRCAEPTRPMHTDAQQPNGANAPFLLGVLDQSPIPEGTSGADALRNSIDLARLADGLGYHR